MFSAGGGPARTAARSRWRAASVRVLAAAVLAAAAAVVGVTVAHPAGASGALTGPDVSSWQHSGGAPIDWGAVRSSGASFAFIKATEGTNYTNPYFAGDWSAAGSAGLYRGGYHYARPGAPLSTTATAQARYFVSVTGSMAGSHDLPPVLDLEETGGLGPADLLTWVKTWLSQVQTLTGRTPMVYSYPSFWQNQMGGTTALTSYPLWLANYTSASNVSPIGGWPTWTFWQYTSSASVPGIGGAVDNSRYCCAGANLAALASASPNAGNPFGAFDSVTASAGQATVAGWAIDPDTTDPVDVSVSVDKGPATTLTANLASPDVAAVFPGFGSAHRFNGTVPVTVGGTHTICITAVNVGYGSGNTSLGCRQVTLAPTAPVAPASTAPRFIGPDNAIVGWSAPTDDGGSALTAYTVTTKGPDGTTSVDVAGSPPATSATLSGLSAGNTYQITITAKNSVGTGPAGYPATITPMPAGSIATACPTVSSTPFTDINTDVHRISIACAYATQLANGTTGTTFDPDLPVSREQMASFLVRLLAAVPVYLPPGTTGPFTDLPVGGVHNADVNRIAALGISNGVTPTTFEPNATVTREQMATFLARAWRVADGYWLPTTTPTTFTDVPTGDTHALDIRAIAAAGITTGNGSGGFSPAAAVPRDQMADFLSRTLDLLTRVGKIGAG